MPSFPKRAFAGAALLACALAAPAFAVDRSAASIAGAHVDLSAVQARRAALLAAPRTASVANHADAPADASTGVTASNYRAYPPSCFSDTLPVPANAIQPLPVNASGPLYSRTVTLYERNGSQDSAEDVTVTIWRVACSSDGQPLNGSNGTPAYNPDGGYVGATLMRIQRQAQYEGDSQLYPLFPDIRIAQGSIAFDNASLTDYVRVAMEPNTVLSDTTINSAIVNSTTYVLENYASPALGFFYFNNAFTIRFDNGYRDSAGNPASGSQFTISVPDYNPTSSTYPAAFAPMPINGYLTGVWRQVGIGSGEGMTTQVFDKDAQTRTFFAYWYTYDTAGIPFWLVAQKDFPIGTTQLQDVPVYYGTDGHFAATAPPSPQYKANTWGTISVSFADCQHIRISAYQGATGNVTGGPGGTSTQPLIWTRLGSINNLACQ